jgi:hypothetical protein
LDGIRQARIGGAARTARRNCRCKSKSEIARIRLPAGNPAYDYAKKFTGNPLIRK